jgi:hypothetical protein
MMVVPTNVVTGGYLDCIAVADASLPSVDLRAGRQSFADLSFITVTWNRDFPDTNYAPACTAETSNPSDNQMLSLLNNLTTTSVTFANQFIAAGTIHCIAEPASTADPVAVGVGVPPAPPDLNVLIPWTPQFTDSNYAAVCSFVFLGATANPSALSVEQKGPSSASAFITSNQGGFIVCLGVSFDTTTTLSVTPPGPTVQAGQVVTLTASVRSNSLAVNGGTVTFFNGNQPLGTVQVTFTDGTATLNTRFGPSGGQPLNLTARYNGTFQLGASTSAPQQLTVTGTEATQSQLNATPNGSNYDFTLSVFGFGLASANPAAGTATLNELQNPPIQLGTFSLNPPANVSFSLDGPHTYPVGNAPKWLATGDFNNDGFPDAVVSNTSDNSLSVLLGKPDGSFAPQSLISLGTVSPQQVVVADFNGDGNVDIAVAVPGDTAVFLLLGNGDGTFQNPQMIPLGSVVANLLAAGDFNGDGFADIVLCGGAGCATLLNNGQGNFAQGPIFMPSATVEAIAVADFNGDGLPDLAFSAQHPGQVIVAIGAGDGSFAVQPNPPNVGVQPLGIVAGDFNHDGFQDLAVADNGGNHVSVLLGNGDGTFQPQVRYKTTKSGPFDIVTTDISGDGALDLLVSLPNFGLVDVLVGHGDGTFQTASPQLATNGNNYLAAVDLNGDGVPDLISSVQSANQISVLLGGNSTPQATLTNIPVLGLGQQSVQSTFMPGGAFYSGGNSNILLLNGIQLPTTTTLSAEPTQSEYLQTVTFTATVTASQGSPTGTVTMRDGGLAICINVPLTVVNGISTAVCNYAFGGLPRNHAMTASYSGDNNYLASQGTLQYSVSQATTSVALAANPPNQQVFGQLVTLTATVTGAFGGIPSGTVDFTDSLHENSVCLGVQLIPGNNNSTATCQTSSLATGQYSLLATYNGDDYFLFGTSQQLPYKIIAATSSTTLSVTPPNVNAGDVVTLVATVTSNNQPEPAGTVAFLSGSQVLSNVQIRQSDGTATLKIRFGPGNYNFTARYNGTNSVGSSISAAQPLSVAGTEATQGQLSATPNGNSYDFTLNVFGFGLAATRPPTGTASLDEQQNPPIHLGDFTLAGGTNTFLQQKTYPTLLANPLDIVAGDFNGDGIIDLAVPNSSNFSVSILLGNGDGSFRAPRTFAAGASPQGETVSDFDGDGFADLAVVNNSAGTVSVLLGKGDGTFQLPQPFEVGSGPTHVAHDDFNGDGFSDLVVTNNNDNNVSVLLGAGNGNFGAQQTYTTGPMPYRVAVGDFNGDGIPDLVVDNLGGSTVSVLLGVGDGSFDPQQTYATGNAPRGVAVGDFNGDGKLDLAVTNYADDTISVLLGRGDGTFLPQQTYPVGNHPSAISAADFNGDGILDLSVTNIDGTSVSVLLGIGDGTFLPQQTYAVGEPSGMAIADFNGDGVADIAVSIFSDPGNVGVLVGGSMTSASLLNVPVPGKGQVSLSATYKPDSQSYSGNTSNSVLVNGNPFASVTTLSADFPNVGISQTVTFKATVTGISNAPTGTVVFTSDGQNICTAVALQPGQNSSTAICQYAFLSMGSHNIVATYSGDNSYQPSTSSPLTETVGQITDYVVTLQVSSPDQGATIILTAMVQPPQHCLNPCPGKAQFTPTGTVGFYTDIGNLGTSPLDANATATLTVGNAGNFTVIYAHYSGDTNFAPATSDPMNSIAPPIIVTMQTTSPGATVPTPLALTVGFPNDGNIYYKIVTCNSPIALGITCTPDPTKVTANPLMANVDVKTTATVGSLRQDQPFGRDIYRVLATVSSFGICGIVWVVTDSGHIRRRIVARVFLYILVCSLLLLTSCGGGSFAPAIPPGGNVAGTPSGEYQITGYATLYRSTGQGSGSDIQVGTPQYFLIHLLVK